MLGGRGPGRGTGARQWGFLLGVSKATASHCVAVAMAQSQELEKLA